VGGKGLPVVGLTTLLPSVSRLSEQNVGASTSHSPNGLHGLLQGELYLFYILTPLPLRYYQKLLKTMSTTFLSSSHHG
jgi:hypothetical protein